MATGGAKSDFRPFLDEETSRLDQILRCVNCYEYFNWRDRIPRVLRCHHPVCNTCAMALLRKSPDITCTCGITTITSGTSIDTQLDVDQMTLTALAFLTLPESRGNLGTHDVPNLLNSVRANLIRELSGKVLKTSEPNSMVVRQISGKRPNCHPSWHNNGNDEQSSQSLSDSESSSSDVYDHDDDVFRVSKKPARRGNIHAKVQPNVKNAESVDDENSDIHPDLKKFASLVKQLAKEEKKCRCGDCSQALVSSGRSRKELPESTLVVRFKCGHLLHQDCALRLLAQRTENKAVLKCPSCSEVLDAAFGNQPEGGKMEVLVARKPRNSREVEELKQSHVLWDKKGVPCVNTLPGYPSGTGVLVIRYTFEDGTQDPSHPAPGKPYKAQGFPRFAYLPLTQKGYEVLCMLKMAFERRLTFNIGSSGSSSDDYRVIWGDIPHKISPAAGGDHGYPDAEYLENVTADLNRFGIKSENIPMDRANQLGIGFSYQEACHQVLIDASGSGDRCNSDEENDSTADCGTRQTPVRRNPPPIMPVGPHPASMSADTNDTQGSKVNPVVVPVGATSRVSLPLPGFSATRASGSNTSQHGDDDRRITNWALGFPGFSRCPSTPSTFQASGGSAAYFPPAVGMLENQVFHHQNADPFHANRQKIQKARGEPESGDEDCRQWGSRVWPAPKTRRQKESFVGGKKQDKFGRPNDPHDCDTTTRMSTEADDEATSSSWFRPLPAGRRDPSPAMSVRYRRGAGSSLPLVMNPSLDPFFKPVPILTKEESDESCNVCLEKLKDGSCYDDAYLDARAVVRLSCGHIFHHHCAVQVVANQAEKSFVKCSSCNQTHGTRVGDQPDGGRMTVELLENKLNMVSASKKNDKTSYSWGLPNPFSGKNSKPAAVDYDAFSLSGFPGTDTIRITYDFPSSGLQGPNHPNPGKYYFATAFPRIAYLPCNEEGYKVLCMLKIAFERRLIFTIGTSSTTGATDTVVWAGIHHKTSNHRGEHGYPDPGYLDRVTEELKEVGITPNDIPDNPAVSLGIGF